MSCGRLVSRVDNWKCWHSLFLKGILLELMNLLLSGEEGKKKRRGRAGGGGGGEGEEKEG